MVAADRVVADLFPDACAASAPAFEGADMSTKLKLLGCDVANFGDTADTAEALVWDDRVGRVYRKLFFETRDGATYLKGGILVGDAEDYGELLAPLSSRGAAAEVDEDDPGKQICSCNGVSRGDIVDVVAEVGDACDYAAVKKCTRAGAGCGGCEPDVKKILAAELEKLGATVFTGICSHFDKSVPELKALLRLDDECDTFEDVIAKYGVEGAHPRGCEACKPAVAGMLASLRNEPILDHAHLQDTNDRSLANMQRGGSYSIVPRIPAGEVTPAGLMALGAVAEKYGLYCKITGAQRGDLFGAAKHDLPAIWAELGAAGAWNEAVANTYYARQADKDEVSKRVAEAGREARETVLWREQCAKETAAIAERILDRHGTYPSKPTPPTPAEVDAKRERNRAEMLRKATKFAQWPNRKRPRSCRRARRLTCCGALCQWRRFGLRRAVRCLRDHFATFFPGSAPRQRRGLGRGHPRNGRRGRRPGVVGLVCCL